MASLVKCLTLDFGSGHDPTVVRSSPVLGSLLAAWNLSGILSLSLSLPIPHSCVVSLKIKLKKRLKQK